jgi:hypothetical protein
MALGHVFLQVLLGLFFSYNYFTVAGYLFIDYSAYQHWAHRMREKLVIKHGTVTTFPSAFPQYLQAWTGNVEPTYSNVQGRSRSNPNKYLYVIYMKKCLQIRVKFSKLVAAMSTGLYIVDMHSYLILQMIGYRFKIDFRIKYSER